MTVRSYYHSIVRAVASLTRVKCATAFLAAMAVGGAARADFTMNYTIELNTPDADHARLNFYTVNDGNHGSGTKLLDDDIELISDQPMVIGTRPDNGLPDLSGVGASDPYHSDRSFVNALGDPTQAKDLTIVWAKPAQTDASSYAHGALDFRVVGARLFDPSNPSVAVGGAPATAAANGGHGALIASAVVPKTATYVEMIPWGLGGDTGPAFGDFLGSGDPPPQIGHLEPGGYNELSPLIANGPAHVSAVPVPMSAAGGGLLFGLIYLCRFLLRRRVA